MQYEEFEKALDTLGIVSRASLTDIKNRYQKLSKNYHPDMQNGDDEEFYEQNPFSKKSNDWFYDF